VRPLRLNANLFTFVRRCGQYQRWLTFLHPETGISICREPARDRIAIIRYATEAPLRWSHGLTEERERYLFVTSRIRTSGVPDRWGVPSEFAMLNNVNCLGICGRRDIMRRTLIVAAAIASIVSSVRAQQPDTTQGEPSSSNSPPSSMRGPAFPSESVHGSAWPKSAPVSQSAPTFGIPAPKGHELPATPDRPDKPALHALPTQPQR
jgi:hypothetical protein